MRYLLIGVLCTFSLVVHAQSNNKGATPVEVENGPNNPVPVTVVNPVDTNVVNTIAADELKGIEFGPFIFTTITVSFASPVRLHAASASVYPIDANGVCKVSVATNSNTVTFDDYQPIGLSALSNGQAATVSQTYDAPIEGVASMQFTAPGRCAVSLSLSYTEIASPSADSTSGTQSLSLAREPRIEVR